MSHLQSCPYSEITIWWLLDVVYQSGTPGCHLPGQLGEYRVSTWIKWAYLQNCLAECSRQEII